jgi:hypothetical protein
MIRPNKLSEIRSMGSRIRREVCVAGSLMAGFPAGRQTGGFWPLSASSRWYAFQPGHHLVCQRQSRAQKVSGLRSAYARHLHVSHFDFISHHPQHLSFKRNFIQNRERIEFHADLRRCQMIHHDHYKSS